jgi:hypothetical protein
LLSFSAICSAIWLRRIAFEGASNICAIAYIVSFGVAGKRLNAPEFNGCSC